MLNHADLQLDLRGRTLEPGWVERWARLLRRPMDEPVRPAQAPQQQPASSQEPQRLPKLAAGMLVSGRWRLESRLGRGGFGEVWAGHDLQTHDAVALKFARSGRRRKHLHHEASVVRQLRACAQLSAFVAFEDDEARPCLVLARGGENLSAYRHRQPGRCLPAHNALRLALNMLSAIDAVHQRGWVHRDIKNSNFVLVGAPHQLQCQLVDFGLARPWPGDSDDTSSGAHAAFVGTPRYASVHVHAGQRPAPRDDLWSWCYALMQLLRGGLPWDPLKRRDEIAAAKQQQLLGDPSALPMPDLLHPLLQLLAACGPAQRPDSRQLRSLLQSAIRREGEH